MGLIIIVALFWITITWIIPWCFPDGDTPAGAARRRKRQQRRAQQQQELEAYWRTHCRLIKR